MMLNAINHQGNGNQTHNEISLHTRQDGYYQKTSIGQDVDRSELLYAIGADVKWRSHWGEQHGVMEFPQQENGTKIGSSNQ